jgi:hypothetical protein
MHQNIGHLGIFVSGKVAKKEHAQIVEVLKSVEALPPGLYAMAIKEHKGAGGKVEYEVEFRERSLEEMAGRLNRVGRVDEKPFEAVEKLSEFNQSAYELFGRPFVQAMANEGTAEIAREFHPLRAQRWAVSSVNPWLAWLPSVAEAVKRERREVGPDHPARKAERFLSEAVSASFDQYREIRDATSEAAFFEIYGSMFSLFLAETGAGAKGAAAPADALELPVVKDALAAIGKGGFPEALTRTAALIGRKGPTVPLERVALKGELTKEYRDLLPDLALDQWRRIRGEQDIIVRYAPEQALATLPRLLADPADRERLLTFFERLLSDERIRDIGPSAGQREMISQVADVLAVPAARRRRIARPRSARTKRSGA